MSFVRDVRVTRFVVAALGCLALTSAGHASELLGAAKSAKVVKVGWAEWSPFQYRDVLSGELKGAMIDIAREITGRLGAKADFVQDGWATLPSGIAAGKFSVALMSITDGRARIVGFTDPIYSSDFTAIVAGNSSFKTWDELNQPGNTIATTTGSAGDEAITALEKEGKIKAEIVRIKDVGAAILAVSSGKNSAYINQRDVLILMAQKQTSLRVVSGRFGYSPAGLAFPKGDADAQKALNAIVADMAKDGTTAAIFKKNGVEGIEIGVSAQASSK